MAADFDQYNLKRAKLLSRRMNIWLYTYVHANLKAADHEQVLSAVRLHSDVEIAQFNHYVQERQTIPNDPSFTNQWALNNTGQTGGTPDADIDAPEAWDIAVGDTTAKGDQVVVAIVDGGCDLNHVDIDFWKNTDEIPNNGLDDDGNGYIDDYDGWNAYNSNGNVPSSSHGTHVAGIAAAIGNNGTGVSGVNWGVKVMPIGGSSGTESIVVEAYGYVLELRATYNATNGVMGAFVVATNSSFGVDFGQPANFPIWCAMYDSMGLAGILSAAATANQNIDIDVQGDVPTACPSDYLLSVTNTTHTDVKNSGAAFGATTIDLGAPGTNVYSTLPGNSYGNLTGTSMATPQVCGAVGFLYSVACPGFINAYKNDPGTYALMIKQAILDGTDPNASLAGITVSGGRLNIYNSALLMQAINCGVTISHTPLMDTQDTLNDYEVLA
ncbi:MAG: S8 family serine peptidase, partial [Candidatus Zixiibacteriota bacterium]